MAMVGETCNRFHVRERRPAQRQPFGLEDARTGLTQCLKRDILQHVGLLKCERLRKQKGRPVSRLPLEPFLTPPVQQDRRTRLCPPSIRPPLPSELPIRKCGHWLLRGTRHDLRPWRREYGRCQC